MCFAHAASGPYPSSCPGIRIPDKNYWTKAIFDYSAPLHSSRGKRGRDGLTPQQRGMRKSAWILRRLHQACEIVYNSAES